MAESSRGSLLAYESHSSGIIKQENVSEREVVATPYSGADDLIQPLRSTSNEPTPVKLNSLTASTPSASVAHLQSAADEAIVRPTCLSFGSQSNDRNSSNMGLFFSRTMASGPVSPISRYSSSGGNSSAGTPPEGEVVIGGDTGPLSAWRGALGSADGIPNDCPEYTAPIVGYEVMEERSRFTIFKVKVEHQLSGRHWYVFRRYTDFFRMNQQLKELFPGLRFALPPKRWFGNNFDPIFLEDRIIGLQAFVNNLLLHKEIGRSVPVRDFFCLDDPPGPDDGIEESRALCESLEDKVFFMQHLMKEKDKEVELLKAEVSMLRSQQQALLKSLKIERTVSAMANSRYNSKPSLDKGIEERSVEPPTSGPISPEDSSNLSEKAFSLEEMSVRSTGDGSTGSQECLPLGEGVFDSSYLSENANQCHKEGSNLDNIPLDNIAFNAAMLMTEEKSQHSESSTPIKCALKTHNSLALLSQQEII